MRCANVCHFTVDPSTWIDSSILKSSPQLAIDPEDLLQPELTLVLLQKLCKNCPHPVKPFCYIKTTSFLIHKIFFKSKMLKILSNHMVKKVLLNMETILYSSIEKSVTQLTLMIVAVASSDCDVLYFLHFLTDMHT